MEVCFRSAGQTDWVVANTWGKHAVKHKHTLLIVSIRAMPLPSGVMSSGAMSPPEPPLVVVLRRTTEGL